MAGFWHAAWSVLWGATWGNNLAWLESLLIAGTCGWLGRDRIGKRLAAWWARHHREHAVAAHLEALRRHEAGKRKDGET